MNTFSKTRAWKRKIVRLSQVERNELEKIISSRKESKHRLRHAKILLKVDEGKYGESLTYKKIMQSLNLSHHAVVLAVKKRFVEEGLEAALNRRKHKPKTFGAEAEKQLLELACSPPPYGCESWSARLLRDKLLSLEVEKSINISTVQKVLKKFHLIKGRGRPKVVKKRFVEGNGNSMTKAELIEQVAEETKLSIKDTFHAINAFTNAISECLKKKDKLALHGFGTFLVSNRKTRTRRNPKTGATLNIEAHDAPRFKPGKQLKELCR